MRDVGAPSVTPQRFGLGRALAGASALGLALVGLVFSEGWIIAAVVGLGWAGSFVLVAAVSALISAFIAYAYDSSESRVGPAPLIARTRAWIDAQRQRASRRAAGLWRVSGLLAVLALSATVGPFVTTVAVKVRGASVRTGYVTAVASSIVFAAVWVGVYSGGIAIVERMLGQ